MDLENVESNEARISRRSKRFLLGLGLGVVALACAAWVVVGGWQSLVGTSGRRGWARFLYHDQGMESWDQIGGVTWGVEEGSSGLIARVTGEEGEGMLLSRATAGEFDLTVTFLAGDVTRFEVVIGAGSAPGEARGLVLALLPDDERAGTLTGAGPGSALTPIDIPQPTSDPMYDPYREWLSARPERTARIRAVGSRIVTWIDGKLARQYEIVDPDRLEGRVGLRVAGPAASAVLGVAVHLRAFARAEAMGRRDVPGDWLHYETASDFSFMIPPTLVEIPVQGVDSYVGLMRSETLEVSFDYGMYSGPLNSRPFPNLYDVSSTRIGGLPAQHGTRTADDSDDHPFKHVVAIRIGDVKRERIGSMTFGLTMTIRCADTQAIADAEKILRSLRFRTALPDGPRRPIG